MAFRIASTSSAPLEHAGSHADMKTKAKVKEPRIPGTPLPPYFHPKDTTEGMITRFSAAFGSSPDTLRGTVCISLGGVTMEMTPAAAQHFADNLKCAIDCVNRAAPMKGAGE